MQKLSADEQREILEELPTALRKVAGERDFYKTRYNEIMQQQRCEKVAKSLLDKGLREGTIQSVTAELEKSAAAGTANLDAIEQAIDYVGPDMSKAASVSDSGANGSSDLLRFVLS